MTSEAPLTQNEQNTLRRLFSNSSHFPTEFKNWLDKYIELNHPDPVGSGIQKKVKIVSATELESLQELSASGVEIIPAPGVGKALVPIFASLAISSGGWTTGTANGYGIFFVLDTSYTYLYFEDPLDGAAFRDTIFPDNVEANIGFIASPLLGYNMIAADLSAWDNLPLSIVSGDTWVGGTTSLTVTIWYDTVSTA